MSAGADDGLVPNSLQPSARCTVGLLTWNAGEDIVPCIRSLLAQREPGLQILWMDNASADGTRQRIAREFPGFPPPAVITNHNLGFCGGHNRLLAQCRTPYYLALNQDAVLAPDYAGRLCDWMDEDPTLAMAQGLVLWPEPGQEPFMATRVWSAGLVCPRTWFGFELGMGEPVSGRWDGRRRVAGVDGSVMMLRMAAVRAVSLPAENVFEESFFAYCEEMDLALRLARRGWTCGVEGAARAAHRGKGSGGFSRAEFYSRYIANHWLMALRNMSARDLARGFPFFLRGQFKYWLGRYARHPLSLAWALVRLAQGWRGTRRFYRQSESQWGPTAPSLKAAQALALENLRESNRLSG